jgi:hypothetical protein
VKNGMPAFWIGWDGEVSREPYPGTLGVDYAVDTFPVDAQGRVAYRDGVTDAGYEGPQTRYVRAFERVSVTVKSIHFDSPKHYGIKATAARDVSIVGNRFTNVQYGGLVYATGIPTTRIAVAAGFVCTLFPPYVYPGVTGSVVAEQNVVENVGTEVVDTHLGECFGLLSIASSGAVTMERNFVRNVGRLEDGTGPAFLAASGLLVIDNYSTTPLVAHNTVSNSAGFGVWDYCFFAPAPGAEIAYNRLVDCASGIVSYSEPAAGPRTGGSIHHNVISQDGTVGTGQSCILAFNVSGALIRMNRFEGDYVGPLVMLLSSTDCTLRKNRDRRSTIPPECPTYYLDASSSGNTIRAASGTALDLGTDNTIDLASDGGTP